MRIGIGLVVLAACGGSEPRAAPPIIAVAPTVKPPIDAAPAIAVDENRFVDEQDKVIQHCSTRPQGDHLIYTVTYDPIRSQAADFEAHGEIELDAAGRIVRTDMHTTIGATRLDDLLSGDPPVLDVPSQITGAPKRRVTLAQPIDLEVGDAPCLAEPLCRLKGDAALHDLTWDADFSVLMVHAYGREQLGALHRIAYDFFNRTEELLCDGDRLVAGSSFGSWFVRPGHEAALETIKSAPRIPVQKFSDELEATRPWLGKETWFTANVIVTRDVKLHSVELRSFERTTGKPIAKRELADSLGMICEVRDHDQLGCEVEQDKHVRLDARTLADRGPDVVPPQAAPKPPCAPVPPTDLPTPTMTMCEKFGWLVMAPAADQHGIVALVGKDGHVKWKLELASEATDAQHTINQLLVATHASTQRVVAIDVTRGKIRWTITRP